MNQLLKYMNDQKIKQYYNYAYYYLELCKYFIKQKGKTSCGLASLAIILNALHISTTFFNEENLIDDEVMKNKIK